MKRHIKSKPHCVDSWWYPELNDQIKLPCWTTLVKFIEGYYYGARFPGEPKNSMHIWVTKRGNKKVLLRNFRKYPIYDNRKV